MLDIEIDGTKLCVSLETIINGMSMEQKREILSWLATDTQVMNSVVDHILGRDEFGWSTGDPNRRQQILSEVEDEHLKDSLRFWWKPWDEIRQKIKDIRSTEHLYWTLYHKIDPDLSWKVRSELNRLGIESNYTTKEGDEDIQKIKHYIDETFKKMDKDNGL